MITTGRKKTEILVFTAAIITFMLMTGGMIYFRIPFVKVLPLYISLAVMFLQSKVQRGAYLLGGINSLLYAAVDTSFGLYASGAQALFLSFPLQIGTFIRWKKKPYGKATVFKRMKKRYLPLLLLVSAAAFGLGYMLFTALGASFVVLDVITLVLGTMSVILNMFGHLEYLAFQWSSTAISIILNISLYFRNSDRFPFFIYALYSLLCVAVTTANVLSLYREQSHS